MSEPLNILSHRFPNQKTKIHQLLRVLDIVQYPFEDRARFCRECVDAGGHFWNVFGKNLGQGEDTAIEYVLQRGELKGIDRPRSFRRPVFMAKYLVVRTWLQSRSWFVKVAPPLHRATRFFT